MNSSADGGRQDQVYSSSSWELFDSLDRSRDPRGPDYLHELAGNLIPDEARILDAGCRDAAHLLRLLLAHPGTTGVGVDPVPWHIQRAAAGVEAGALAARVELVEGLIDDLDYPSGHFDFIWCRDVLEVVSDLYATVAAMSRLLSPEGRLLVYTAFATDLLEPREADMLHEGLGNVPANFVRSHVEGAFTAAGLTVDHVEVVGTEWREYDEERTQPASQALLRLARLRHNRAAVISTYGEAAYLTAEASLHWLTYLLLGKIEPVIYVLKGEPRSSRRE